MFLYLKYNHHIDLDSRMKTISVNIDVILYSKELDDNQDGLFYKYEYGSLINQVKDLLESKDQLNEKGLHD